MSKDFITDPSVFVFEHAALVSERERVVGYSIDPDSKLKRNAPLKCARS